MKLTPKQTSLTFRTWGGKRPGAGRKPLGKKPKVPHAARPLLASRFPVHVTLKVAKGLPSLRRKDLFTVIQACLVRGKERFGFRVVQFSVQGNHLHLLCEARDRVALSRGIKGLSVRLAKGLNKLLGRSGQLFPERYHARILRTPTEVHRVLRYLLLNTRRHAAQQGRQLDSSLLDHRSSAFHFDGWRGLVALPASGRAPPVARPHTWLLRVGWRNVQGPIDPMDVPGRQP